MPSERDKARSIAKIIIIVVGFTVLAIALAIGTVRKFKPVWIYVEETGKRDQLIDEITNP